MKKIFNLALATVLALGVVSCSNDDLDNNTNLENKTNGKLTFVLPYASSVTTYAQEVPASDDEKEIELGNTSLYMFDSNDDLEEILSLNAAPSIAGKVTATIDIDDAWTGGKTFIMVANNTSASTDLDEVADGTKGQTLAAFKTLITNSQGTTQIACPLLMTGIESVSDIQTASAVNMELFRSVARFDIKNDATANKVTIKNVYITNTNRQGYVMGYERSSLEANTQVDIATGIATGDLDAVPVTSQNKEGAFYLYPAVIDANAAKAVITLEVEEEGGAKAFYTVHKFNTAGTAKEDLTIEANKRYIIASKINPVSGTLMFTLSPADWDEGNDVIGVPGTGSAFSVIAPAASDVTNGTFNATYNSIAVTDPTLAFTANLAVAGTSTKGVTAQVIGTTGAGLIEVGSNIISVTTPTTDGTVTYAAPYFKYTFTVKFDAGKIEDGKNFSTIVRLTDTASGATTDIYICFEGDNAVAEDGETPLYPTGAGYLPAVKIGDLYWAPVNVGARSESDYGYLFQWGNSDPIVTDGNTVSIYPNTISYSEYQSKIALGSFVTNGSGTLDWLNEGDSNFSDRNSAWVNNSSTPCPTGWSVPSRAQLQLLVNRRSTTSSWTIEDKGIRFREDNLGESYVLFTFNPSIVASGAIGAAASIYIWGSEYSYSDPNHLGVCVSLASGSFQLRDRSIIMALPIRCVKDVI